MVDPTLSVAPVGMIMFVVAQARRPTMIQPVILIADYATECAASGDHADRSIVAENPDAVYGRGRRWRFMTVPLPKLKATVPTLLMALLAPSMTVPAPNVAPVRTLEVLSVRVDVPIVLVRATPEIDPVPAIV